MRLEPKKYLYDVSQASELLEQFAHGKSFAEYQTDAMLRSAVERQFEIIGEALRRLSQEDPATAAKISEHGRIIAFRNILIHGYARSRRPDRLGRLTDEASHPPHTGQISARPRVSSDPWHGREIRPIQ